MDGSWWRVLTKCGPLGKGMANHFSILALRTPWTLCKSKKNYHNVLQVHSWAYIWRKPQFEKIHTPKCSLQHYLQWPEHESNLTVHWQMNGIGCGVCVWVCVCVYIYIYTYVYEYYYSTISYRKEWNNVICSNMDASRDYHIKWTRLGRARQILHANTYT